MPGQFSFPHPPDTELEAQHQIVQAILLVAEQLAKLEEFAATISSSLAQINHKLGRSGNSISAKLPIPTK
jgi:hypothetical protein